jgi:hypothetical protein
MLFFIPRPVTATKKQTQARSAAHDRLPASSFIIVLSLFDDLSPAETILTTLFVRHVHA